MPKVVSKGNDKYGGDCDGGFGQLTGGRVYYSANTQLFFSVSVLFPPR